MAGGGDLDSEALARAEAALAALDGDYLRWAEADVAALAGALAALKTAEPRHWQSCADHLYAIAHDIKGQGATFGYPLMSRLGQAMCAALRDASASDAVVLARLDALAAAMAEVLSSRLSGDGGQRGHDLLARAEAGGTSRR